MPFMKHEITDEQLWYEVYDNGTTCYPAKYFDRETLAKKHDVPEDAIEVELGYGARLSSPGYLYCTEWTVHNTAEEAKAYLDETYPEDAEE